MLRWFRALFSGVRLVFTLVVALIGAAGVVALIPRVSMSPGSTLDPLDPFATPFGLKNDGYQTLSQITFACGVNYLDTATKHPALATVDANLTAHDLGGEILAPAESTEMFCPIGDIFRISEPATAIDIDIYVLFSARFIPKPLVRCFRFATSIDDKGSLRWRQRGFGRECRWQEPVLNFTGNRRR